MHDVSVMAYDEGHFSFETSSIVILHNVEERMYIFLYLQFVE